MTILCIYAAQPTFPATDQAPGALRVQIGSLWVDYTGATPIQADVDAVFAPAIAEAARLAALRGDARAIILINALTTKDNTALNAAVAARYPGLANDALKAVQDIALVLASIYRA